MIEKKRIAFYNILANGHFNFCASIAQALLNNFSNVVEIYFIVDELFANKLRKIDDRFKYGIIQYEKPDQQNRITDLVAEFEELINGPSLVENLCKVYSKFLEDVDTLAFIDKKTQEQIELIRPNFLLCDQIFHLPSMRSAKAYGFICSCNPLVYGFENYPLMGSDAGVDETDKIKQFAKDFEPTKEKLISQIEKVFKMNGVPLPTDQSIFQPINKNHFSVYSYPSELDYYSEEIKEKYRLWQVDSPLIAQRIPKPFQLPKSFEALEGQIIYISLGSLFSAYYEKIERMINILNKLNNVKFIVSKGPNGDKLKFPSNRFIGENYVDQLAVLQVVSLAIVHGGNNTFAECIHFGVKQIVCPVMYDQINNAKRVVECGFGYSLPLLNYTEDELLSTVKKALNDDKMSTKLTKVKERIKKDDKLNKLSTKIMNYVDNL